MNPPNTYNQRQHERFTLAPAYTWIQITTQTGEVCEGHAYDISIGGARVEIDHPLEIGERVEVMIELAGWTEPIHASGEVVWMNDAQDDPGPTRMAISFTQFSSGEDLKRLARYVGSGMVYRAA